jgi:hypothetical protein
MEKKELYKHFLNHFYTFNNFYDLKYEIKKHSDLIGIMFKEYPKTKKFFKKICKKIYDMQKDYLLFESCPKLINQGVKVISENGESWYYWYLFECETIEEVEKIIDKYGNGSIYIEGDRINSIYDCTGKVFSHDMRIRKVGKNRVLATKWYGLDV